MNTIKQIRKIIMLFYRDMASYNQINTDLVAAERWLDDNIQSWFNKHDRKFMGLGVTILLDGKISIFRYDESINGSKFYKNKKHGTIYVCSINKLK